MILYMAMFLVLMDAACTLFGLAEFSDKVVDPLILPTCVNLAGKAQEKGRAELGLTIAYFKLN